MGNTCANRNNRQLLQEFAAKSEYMRQNVLVGGQPSIENTRPLSAGDSTHHHFFLAGFATVLYSRHKPIQ